MEIAKSIIIKGRVQGVNFRYHARQEALRLGLRGSVMNLPDGSVQVKVEGEDEKVRALVNWCKKGPSFARVDGLEVEEIPAQGYNDFRILR